MLSRVPPDASSNRSAPLLGSVEPRLFTPPLRELTPETSYGFAVIEFARDVLRMPLDPWEDWAVVHAGELLEDGRPRFRTVLILVARQNGKTFLLMVLVLYWIFVECWAMVLGMSTNLDYARVSWLRTAKLAERIPELRTYLQGDVREANGQECMTAFDDDPDATDPECLYKIAAANRRGGRSLSVDRLVIDELREHQSWDAWNASTKTLNARPLGQIFAITNQGDDTSVVLDALRDSALAFLSAGVGDPRLGLLEWSAPEGSDVQDPAAHAAANPQYGRRIDPSIIAGDAARAGASTDPAELNGFKTEVLCMRVRALNAAITLDAWNHCYVAGDLSRLRGGIAACLDVSPDEQHATLCAAAMLPDGRIRVEVVMSWSGPAALAELRRELAPWVRRVKPRVLGWLPAGPAAALAADFTRVTPGRRRVFPSSVELTEIRAEVSAVCMGYAEQIRSKQLLQAGDPLLTDHSTGASRHYTGDTWRFARQGVGHVDAAYAGAGAVHLARTMPASIGDIRVVTTDSEPEDEAS